MQRTPSIILALGALAGLVVAVTFVLRTQSDAELPAAERLPLEPSGHTSVERAPPNSTRLDDRVDGAETDGPPPAPPAEPGSPAEIEVAENAAGSDTSPELAESETRLVFNSRLFADLPFDDAQATIDELDLDQIDGMTELIDRGRHLQRVIANGERQAIGEAARDYLQAASKLQTPEVQRRYLKLLKTYHRVHDKDPREVGDIKQVLVPAFQSAQELARVR